MRYQEVKAKAAAKLAAMAAASGLPLGLGLAFRETLEPAINRFWMTRSGGGYVVLVFYLVLFTVVFGLACILNLATSPARDARLLKWAEARKTTNGSKFDKTLLEPNHPDWEVSTLRYLMRRLRRPR